MTLPTDAKARKAIPMYSGLLKYFPLALAAVAKHSAESHEQHNPGEPLHWSREKSSDHCECIIRHLTDYGCGDKKAMRAIAWRALAQLELDEEDAVPVPVYSPNMTATEIQDRMYGANHPKDCICGRCLNTKVIAHGDECTCARCLDQRVIAAQANAPGLTGIKFQMVCSSCGDTFNSIESLRYHQQEYGHGHS